MPTIEERARKMLNEVRKERSSGLLLGNTFTRLNDSIIEAFCRKIEAHDATLAEFEAFKREVSDTVRQYERELDGGAGDFTKLRRFILPKPVDPLVEAVCVVFGADVAGPGDADKFRAALAKRNLKLVETGDA